jgi:hypothetical protein
MSGFSEALYQVMRNQHVKSLTTRANTAEAAWLILNDMLCS